MKGWRRTPKGKKTTRNGVTFKSEFEANVADKLTDLGVKWEYEPEKFKWHKPCYYTPDFKVTLDDGTTFYLESKGYFPPEDQAKMAGVHAEYPDMDLRFVFQNPNSKIYPLPKKKEPTLYSQWAEKRGFKWCGKEVPDEWIAKE